MRRRLLLIVFSVMMSCADTESSKSPKAHEEEMDKEVNVSPILSELLSITPEDIKELYISIPRNINTQKEYKNNKLSSENLARLLTFLSESETADETKSEEFASIQIKLQNETNYEIRIELASLDDIFFTINDNPWFHKKGSVLKLELILKNRDP